MAEAAVQVLVESLTSLIQREIGLILGVEKEMKKLSNTFTTIQKVLEDAEDKQFQSKSVQNWLCQLNGVASEIEDVLDECETEVFKMRRKSGNFCLKKNLYKYKMGRRIRDAVEKLEAIAKDREQFRLQETAVQQLVDWRRETGSVVNEGDEIYGRDEEREKMVDLLLNQAKECEQLSVLPITGIGGMGKTTLAQLVFNDERVSQHFEAKLWVCVSDDFNEKAILRAMLESATGSKSNLENLDSLQRSVSKELRGKRYLLVLDDVWNDNQEDWLRLQRILACGSTGASVIVTTRLKKVADIMGTLPPLSLAELSEDDCWLLFKQRAFGQQSKQQNHGKLETIGKRIVKKCGGVPLAARALGGLLYFKREEKEWIHVEESHIWNLPEEDNSILPVLRLSYRHLPHVLKQCFVYFAVFPRDYPFDKEEMILHWMAHGYISSNGTQEVEEVGNQTWNELVLRSLLEEVNMGILGTTFTLHDLVHDLAQSIMETKIPKEETSVSNSKIREFHWRRDAEARSSGIALQVSTLDTIMNYKRLRILKMNGAEMEDLPSAILKLKQLRYLDLSGSSIRALPHKFCCLVNLKILKLNKCRQLKSLPKNFNSMTNLRHIYLNGCDSLSHMPYRIRELVSLKTLCFFIVGDKIGHQLDELEHLNLGDNLEIKHLESARSHMIAKKANLVGKSNLRELVLGWGSDGTSSKSTEPTDDEKVLEGLDPHINLRRLEIRGFRGREFALWMNKLTNLRGIALQNCRNCRHLPQLGGLPLLEYLTLRNLDCLEYIMEDDGENTRGPRFPLLERLRLDGLPRLKGWSKDEAGGEMFPCLESLTIRGCELFILASTSISSTLKKLKDLSCSPLTLPLFSSELLKDLTLDFSITGNSITIPEDALQGLCNLKTLNIENACEQSLPQKWCRGLTSLTRLIICNSKIGNIFPEGWFGHLTALEEVGIVLCTELQDMGEIKHSPVLRSLTLCGLDELTSLPDWLSDLTSLTSLHIYHCPDILSLPSTIKQMTNLRELHIRGCPQLEERCRKGSGQDWHNIDHIPHLELVIGSVNSMLYEYMIFYHVNNP